MRPSLIIALSIGLLLSVSAPARGQDVLAPDRVAVPTSVTHLGVYDQATGSFVEGTAEGTGLGTLVFDNTDSSNVVYFPIPELIDLDWGSLDAGGLNSIRAIGISYGTMSPGPIDLGIRLHKGVMALQQGGQGIIVPVQGLPGSDDGTLVGFSLIVLLNVPLVLPDGPIRVGYKVPDTDTGPLLVFPSALLGTKDRLDRFDPKGTFLNNFKFSGGEYASLYIQLYGESPLFSQGNGIDSVLSQRDRVRGRVGPDGDVDVYRYRAVKGERLRVNLAAKASGGLLPRLEITDASNGALITATGAAASKFAVNVMLPSAGTFDISVSGFNDTSGDYVMKVSASLPKQASKLVSPLAGGEGQAGNLLTFVAKPGSLFSGVVRPTSQTSDLVDPPVLDGPTGPVDIEPYTSRKDNVFKIKKLPLDVFGAFALRPGPKVGPGLQAKGRVRQGKEPRNRLDEGAAALTGSWLMDEFLTDFSSSRLNLSADKKGASSLVRKQDEFTITRRLKKWSVGPASDFEDNGGQLLTYKVQLPVLIEGGVLTPPAESTKPVVDRFVFPNGNPDEILFENSGVLWRRDFDAQLGVPTVTAISTDSHGLAGVPDGQLALSFTSVEGATAYEIYRAPATVQLPPSFPYDFVRSPGNGQLAVWVEPQVGGPGTTPQRYWVRAVDAGGVRGAFSIPVSGTP